MILAIGGAGCNIAKAIKQKTSDKRLQDASFVFLDSDEEHLTKFEEDNNSIIVLKEEADVIPPDMFNNSISLVIVAGLGGNTTYKFLPTIISIENSASVPDISVVATTPFLFEGKFRITKALETVSKIQEFGNVKINLLNNEDLINRYPELNIINAFELADNAVIRLIEETLS